MKKLVRSALTWMFEDYRINIILATDATQPRQKQALEIRTVRPTDEALLLSSDDEQMRKAASYSRQGLQGFCAANNQNTPLCVAHFATAEQYERTSTWPLAANEVALMDIVTEPSGRGKGMAGLVMAEAAKHYLAASKERLIAFVWWSNHPSLRAFHKAGWKRIGWSVELKIAQRWFSLRLPLP